MVRIPELQVQHAIRLKQENNELAAFATSDVTEQTAKKLEELHLKEEYDDLVLKQSGFEGLCEALSGKAFANDTKVSFSHLTKEKLEDVLADVNVPQKQTSLTSVRWMGIPEVVSDFFGNWFEKVAITSDHGIFIFHYNQPKEESKTATNANKDEEVTNAAMQQRAEILQEIGNFKDKCITTVSIEIDKISNSPIIPDPVETKYGYHFQIIVSKNKITQDTKYCFKKIAEMIKDKIPKKRQSKKSLFSRTQKRDQLSSS